MAETAMGAKYWSDPEYIDEAWIPKEVYNRFKITKSEWETWMQIHQGKRG